MSAHPLRPIITSFGALISRPEAFLIVLVYAGLWFVFEHETFDWHAVATLATWMMTLFIQRSEHRDTQAIHAKLDELLHAEGAASSGLTRIDEKEPEQIESERAEHRRDD